MRTVRAWVMAAGMAAGAGTVVAGAATTPATRAGDPPATESASAPAARALVTKAMRDVETILRDAKLSRDEKRDKVRALADENIDFETMGRLAMGANWRDLSEAQRNDFTKEFRQHVINTYAHFTDDYGDEDLVVSGDNGETRGDWTVQTRIMGMKDGARQELAKVDYRLRQTGGTWKIIDITIEGVSMMANFRAQFQDIMTSGGFAKLIKLLREKNAAGAGEPGGKNH
jgi:phospholipid transport system substrate-binding protein